MIMTKMNKEKADLALEQASSEKAFIFIKNDAVERGLIGEIISAVEKTGLKIVALKMVTPTEEQIKNHYHDKKDWLKDLLVKDMVGKTLVAVIVEGVNALDAVYKLTGPTEPKTAPPSTIRGMYSTEDKDFSNISGTSLHNLVHRCDPTPEACEEEIQVWFTQEEIHKYMTVLEKARAYDRMSAAEKVKKIIRRTPT